MKIPNEIECVRLLDEMGVADTILGHSMRVHSVAMRVCDVLERKGIVVDRKLVSAASLLHDILKLQAREHHHIKGAEFLRGRGMSKVAAVVEKHGLNTIGHPELHPTTYEEKIMFYSDLRVLPGRIGTLKERFAYIREKYSISEATLEKAEAFAKELELEFFGELGPYGKNMRD